MKLWIIFGTGLLLTACGGALSDEQRREMREGMAQQKVMKVSDADIVAAAMEKGSNTLLALEAVQFEPTRVDSIATAQHVTAKWMVPGSPGAAGKVLESQLIEAYVLGAASGAIQDNLQKMWTDEAHTDYDSLFYSHPMVKRLPDGSDQLEGVWNIYISRRDLILEMARQKKKKK